MIKILLLWLLSLIIQPIEKLQQRKREQIPMTENQSKPERIQASENRQAIAGEKERRKKEQAAADKSFIIHQMDIYSEFLRQADQQLKIINWEIWKDEQQQEYDSADARRKKLEPLQKKILSYETKIHSLESKLARAEYILQD